MILRPYQQAAVNACWDFIRNRPGNPALVLPTGAGKSPLMAALARDSHTQWNGRVGIIAHTQELVFQNHDKFRSVAPDLPSGIYSASLGRRDRFDPILFLQIQSVAHRAATLGGFDLLLIDEAHRIPLKGEGRYRRFIDECRVVNPNLRVVGLTATPYRLQGQAVPVCGPEFILNEVAYEARIPELIADGYLCPLVSKQGDKPDLSGVHLKGGEYVEDELASAMIKLVERTADDMLVRAVGRKCAALFCVNTAHSLAFLDALHRRGESAAILYDGQSGKEREDAIDGHKSGKYRWLVNVNIASEGYDNPMIDLVVMTRPTKSPGLMYQQIGRGFRVIYATGYDLDIQSQRVAAIANGPKPDCLVLDYAGNVLEHGPVDQIRVRSPKRGKAPQVQTGAAKACPKCEALIPAGCRTCPECGHVFAVSTPDHLDRPVNAPVLSTERERVVTAMTVSSVKYERHTGKGGKPDSLRVTYQCGLRRISEWVCLQHSGFARTRALEWWVRRAPADVPPRTVEEALPLAWLLPRPASITVDETDKYPTVMGYEFADVEVAAAEPVSGLEARKTPAWLVEATNGHFGA